MKTCIITLSVVAGQVTRDMLRKTINKQVTS